MLSFLNDTGEIKATRMHVLYFYCHLETKGIFQFALLLNE